MTTSLSSQEKDQTQLSAFLSIIWNINFGIITLQDLKDNANVTVWLKSILQRAETTQMKLQKETGEEVKTLYIRTSILAHFKDLPAANSQAFNFFGSKLLYTHCPDLVLIGLTQLNINSFDPGILAARLVLPHLHKKLNEIQARPKKTSGVSNSNNSQALALLNSFEKALSNICSVSEIYSLVKNLSDGNKDTSVLKIDILVEFQKFGLDKVKSNEDTSKFGKIGKTQS
jgi:hypothetical protein